MQQIIYHPWNLTPQDAESLQRELAKQVITHDCFGDIQTVVGVDVAYDQQRNKLIAGAVVLDIHSLQVLERSVIEDSVRFPYIPGLFSFRELPPIAAALEQLKLIPDLIVCDGQGIAHPRRFGLACHLGVLFDIPTIGCGKTRLIGTFNIPDINRGSSSPLMEGDTIVGQVLRTQNNIKPIYVSIGHKISLATACKYILQLAPKYRLPETIRQADQVVRAALKQCES